MEHTPLHWERDPEWNRSFIVNGNKFHVAYFTDPETGKKPDFILLDTDIMPMIHAVPDLLAACEALVWLANDHEWEETDGPELKAARAAIAKAKG